MEAAIRLKLCLLALARLALVFSSGYVHADEFFQGGQEVFACRIIRRDGCYIPWEFWPEHALRCVTWPWLVARLPLWLVWRVMRLVSRMAGWLQALGLYGSDESGRMLLYVPRLLVVCASFIQDAALLSIAQSAYPSNSTHSSDYTSPKPTSAAARDCLLVYMSCWSTLIFSSRPFSNTLESLALALALKLAVTRQGTTAPWHRAMGMGALFAAGIFIRFTFVAFALPIAAHELGRIIFPRGWDIEGKSAQALLRPALRYIALVGVSAALVAVPLIVVDTVYYTQRWWPPVVTPLNMALYNSRPSNLAKHGLHPRYLHALVNLPMLYSVLMPLAIHRLITSFSYQRHHQHQQQQHLQHQQHERVGDDGPHRENNITLNLCTACVVSGVLLLSIAPHQEPRFLLPLSTPLSVLAGPLLMSSTRRRGRTFRVLWIVHQAVCVLFFGILHQGGVVPSLLRFGETLAPSKADSAMTTMRHTLLFYGTYMPPRFLLGTALPLREPDIHEGPAVEVLDLGDGATTEVLHATVVRACSTENSRCWVVAPGSVELQLDTTGRRVVSERLQWPHLSTENPPRLARVLEQREWSLVMSELS